jgi:hypothetical protein
MSERPFSWASLAGSYAFCIAVAFALILSAALIFENVWARVAWVIAWVPVMAYVDGKLFRSAQARSNDDE